MPDYDAEFGQSKELHEYGMANGQPPMAHKLVMIDFDQTIVPWGALMEAKVPMPGAIKAIKALRDRGYRIGIFTSRMSESWLLEAFGHSRLSGKEQHAYVADILDRAGIVYEFITAEKLPAHCYIDDKAIGFRGDWDAVLADPLVA